MSNYLGDVDCELNARGRCLTEGIESYQLSSREEYALAMLSAMDYDTATWPPNRYLWDMLPTRRDFNRDLRLLSRMAARWNQTSFNPETISRFCSTCNFMEDSSFLRYNW